MFGNSLAGHAEMPAKLIQSLAIVLVELVEESAPVWVGQRFKNIVHVEARYATKWLHISPAFATPCSQINPALIQRLPESVLQIKRAGPEIDDPVMGPKNLRPEESRHGLGTSEQTAMNETFQIDHAHLFAKLVHRTDGEPAEAGAFHTTLLLDNGIRTELRCSNV